MPRVYRSAFRPPRYLRRSLAFDSRCRNFLHKRMPFVSLSRPNLASSRFLPSALWLTINYPSLDRGIAGYRPTSLSCRLNKKKHTHTHINNHLRFIYSELYPARNYASTMSKYCANECTNRYFEFTRALALSPQIGTSR